MTTMWWESWREGWAERVVIWAAPVALAVVTVLAGPVPAGAQAAGSGDDDPPGLDCLTDARGTLGVTPGTVNPGQLVTLSWNVQAPASCGALAVTVDNLSAPRSGSRTVDPIATRSYSLRASYGGASRSLATTSVTVQLPTDASGRPTVTLTANNQLPLLIQALGTENARIVIQNHVRLDLTGRENIWIAAGVQLLGGRTTREPGALLFRAAPGDPCEGLAPIYFYVVTCERPPQQFLFKIDADNVRISGLRIFGGETSSPQARTRLVHGITVFSGLNIDIDNNELFGWTGSAVRVQDTYGGRICHVPDDRCPQENTSTVRIRYNYIHHNQHEGGDGYGVSIDDGAYALIERNVFDYNRHAIAGDGSDGSGYRAYDNLVLKHGGVHEVHLGYTFHTHQFDMHGQDSCGIGHLNCGRAGEFIDIRRNTFFFVQDGAFKLRGTPSLRAQVESNVFAHLALVASGGAYAPALQGNTSDMQIADNLIGVNESGNFGRCDFDGDGVEDLFLATGQTWWFNSGGNRHWVYLNSSRKRLSELTLAGDVDGDRRCDVIADGTVLSGGTGKLSRNPAEIVWRGGTGEIAIRTMNGGTVVSDTRPGVMDEAWRVAAIGDFSADGNPDLLWRAADGRVSVWEMANGYKLAETYVSPAGEAWNMQGTGDFDGDGVADLLWRDARGQLAIWFKGRYAAPGQTADPDAVPTAYPGYRNLPEPVALAWTVLGVGDFDGDGRADILWRHQTGQTMIWSMVGGLMAGESYPSMADSKRAGSFETIADFDNDGRADVLWRSDTGVLTIWFGGDATRVSQPSHRNLAGALDPAWRVAQATDFNRDGRADLLWRDETTGGLMLWFMAGARFLGEAYPRPPQLGWQLADRIIERTREADETDEVNDELPVDRRPGRGGLP